MSKSDKSHLIQTGLALAEREDAGLTMDFRPLYDRLLVQIIPSEDREVRGVVIPRMAQESAAHLRGVVIAAGHGRVTAMGDVLPMMTKVDDIVMFLRAGNEQVLIPSAPGTEFILIREFHVLGIYGDLPKATGVLDATGRQVVEPS